MVASQPRQQQATSSAKGRLNLKKTSRPVVARPSKDQPEDVQALERLRRRAEADPDDSDSDAIEWNQDDGPGADGPSDGGPGSSDQSDGEDGDDPASGASDGDSEEDSGEDDAEGGSASEDSDADGHAEGAEEPGGGGGGYYSDEGGEEQGQPGWEERTQALPLSERVQRLAHGAGPSRHRHQPSSDPSHGLRGAELARKLLRERREAVRAGRTASESDGGSGSEEEGPVGANGGEDPSAPPAHRGIVPKRANKNRPTEMPSTRAVGRHREVVQVKKSKARDPRFEPVSGKLNYDMFHKAYGFLEQYQDSEVEQLKRSLKREKDRSKANNMHTLLTRLQQERAERRRGEQVRQTLQQRKRQERQAVAQGKQPYFMKASEKKKVVLDQRFQELKDQGKLRKFLEKKRKRNANKDHRWLPSKRRAGGDVGHTEE